MAVDVEELETPTVRIEGSSCLYVLSVVGREGLEVSVFENTNPDLRELKDAIEHALLETDQVVLLRAEAGAGAVKGWGVLEPKVFASRIPAL